MDETGAHFFNGKGIIYLTLMRFMRAMQKLLCILAKCVSCDFPMLQCKLTSRTGFCAMETISGAAKERQKAFYACTPLMHFNPLHAEECIITARCEQKLVCLLLFSSCFQNATRPAANYSHRVIVCLQTLPFETYESLHNRLCNLDKAFNSMSIFNGILIMIESGVKLNAVF